MDKRRYRGRAVSLMAILVLWPVMGLGAEMNISQFVFRDVNRNGVYDRGEPPFAGIGIQLTQEGRPPIVRESNLSGFANFPMSSDDASQDITAAGPVSFSVQLPDGMVLTTGNPSQSARIVSVPEAPGGFAMEPVNRFMAVAPDLTIRTGIAGLTSMTCTSSGGITLTAIKRDAHLTCNVTAGPWTVDWLLADGTSLSRQITVTDWPVQVPVGTAAVSDRDTMTLTFDDMITTQNIVEMPSFNDFHFHNFVVAHHKYYGGWGYVNGTVSGEFAAYNSSGHPAKITSDTRFGLAQVYVSAAWPGGTRHPVEFTALRDGEVVASDFVMISNLGPILFVPHWTDIDTLVIRHSAYWQVVMDDLQLTR